MAKKLMLYFLKCLSSEVSIENLFRIRPSSVGNKAERRISKRVFQENKARQIFRKTHIFYPLIRRRVGIKVGGRGKKCSLFGKFDKLCFLETRVLIFDLLSYYQRSK